MIQKQRVKPIKLCKLETLHRRLDESHPKQLPIEKALSSYAAGYRGEQAIDYHLTFVNPSHMIFHGLRLQDSSSYFQIDTLLVTPSFFLIIEVKNIAGTLDFDPKRFQMVRHLHGAEEGFSDPRLQVTRHHLQLEKWLRHQKLPVPPIYQVVAISFPNTIIHAPSSSFGKVIHAAQLPYDIIDLEKKHLAPSISAADMDNIASRLNRHHRSLDPDILPYFEIKPEDIKKGVICSVCGVTPMRWQAEWKCEHCGHTSKDDHMKAMIDYARLYGTTISNQQFCDFLGLPSRKIGTRILRTLQVKHNHKHKGRTYDLSSFLEK